MHAFCFSLAECVNGIFVVSVALLQYPLFPQSEPLMCIEKLWRYSFIYTFVTLLICVKMQVLSGSDNVKRHLLSMFNEYCKEAHKTTPGPCAEQYQSLRYTLAFALKAWPYHTHLYHITSSSLSATKLTTKN
jgi:hypothetical protein